MGARFPFLDHRLVRGQLGREYDLIIGGKRVKTAEKIKLEAVAFDHAVTHASAKHEPQVEILEGIGHVPQLEAPDRFFPILLGFLQDPPANP